MTSQMEAPARKTTPAFALRRLGLDADEPHHPGILMGEDVAVEHEVAVEALEAGAEFDRLAWRHEDGVAPLRGLAARVQHLKGVDVDVEGVDLLGEVLDAP